MSSDEELMQAVQQGDSSAFERIVRRYQTVVWGTACRFLNDAVEAEDVAQEAFLRVLEAAPRYQPTARFKSYLLQIVTRLCLDRVRKKRPIYTEDLPDGFDTARTPDQALMDDERRRRVRRAMEQLPSQQRLVLSLRYDGDLSYEEIAAVLGVSEKAVERTLARARSALAVRLGEL